MNLSWIRTGFALLCVAWVMASLPVEGATSKAMEIAVHDLAKQWALVNYKTGADRKEAAFENLARKAHELSSLYPRRAEPLIWEAIIISTKAGVAGPVDALKLVKKARGLLLQAEKIDSGALDGSAYTTLGSLYYKVPGWPVSFGDSRKAREYLERALKINPEGIDPNFFYGELLLKEKEYAAARRHLEKVLKAPPRKDRPIADAGRKAEAKKLLAEATR